MQTNLHYNLLVRVKRRLFKQPLADWPPTRLRVGGVGGIRYPCTSGHGHSGRWQVGGGIMRPSGPSRHDRATHRGVAPSEVLSEGATIPLAGTTPGGRAIGGRGREGGQQAEAGSLDHHFNP